MKIGFMMWEPGLTGSTLVSAGGAVWVTHLFANLRSSGHEVVWLAEQPAPLFTRRGTVDECHVVFFFWRWSMPEYPDRERVYQRQWQLIDEASYAGIPIIVHDQDHKISGEDMFELGMRGAILTAPELNPRRGFRTLMFPDPYGADRNLQLKLPPIGPQMVYIGNNYERYEQAKLFLPDMAKCFDVDVWGNWTDPGPNRQSPEQVRADFPGVTFRGRLPQEDTIATMAQAASTIHLFKPSYGETGFVTIRWAEAVAAQTPAFIPSDMWLPGSWRSTFLGRFGLVMDGDHMVYNFINMSSADLMALWAAERDFVAEYMRPEPWLKLIEEVTK